MVFCCTCGSTGKNAPAKQATSSSRKQTTTAKKTVADENGAKKDPPKAQKIDDRIDSGPDMTREGEKQLDVSSLTRINFQLLEDQEPLPPKEKQANKSYGYTLIAETGEVQPKHILELGHLNKTIFIEHCKINLSYSETGDPAGFPVLAFLGVGSHRYISVLLNNTAKENGIRLICIDRPGQGQSEGMKHNLNRIEEWPGVVEEFCNQCGIPVFGLIGQSLGAGFALAAGRALRRRLVGGCHLVGAWASLRQSGPGHRRPQEGLRRAADKLPTFLLSGLLHTVNFLFETSSSLPAKEMVARARAECSRAEWATLGRPEVLAVLDAIAADQRRRRDRQGVVDDVLLALEKGSRALPFDYQDVRCPVTVWHGDRDRVVPIAAAVGMCARFPDSKMEVKEKGTHSLLMDMEVINQIFNDISTQVKAGAAAELTRALERAGDTQWRRRRPPGTPPGGGGSRRASRSASAVPAARSMAAAPARSSLELPARPQRRASHQAAAAPADAQEGKMPPSTRPGLVPGPGS